MKRIMVLAASLVICLVGQVSAQPTIKSYGFGIMPMPLHQDEMYKLSLARLGTEISHGGLVAKFDYNLVAPEIKLACGEVTRTLGPGSLSLTVGRQLSSVGALYPSPRLHRLPRFASAQTGFAIGLTGLAACYQQQGVKASLAHFGENSLLAAVRYGNAGVYWQQDVGVGGQARWEGHRFFNPFVGVVRYDNSGQTVAFVENYVAPVSNLRLYVHADFGDTHEEWLSGVSYEYASDSFVKIYYDTRKGGAVSELTFSVKF